MSEGGSRPSGLESSARTGIFWITPTLAQGTFADELKAPFLLDQGVTHLVNVSDIPSSLTAADGFRAVIDLPLSDLTRIPEASIARGLDVLWDAQQQTSGRVFLHCVAGRNRSAAMLWLFLIACGMPARQAQRRIEDCTLDAIPDHPAMVDAHSVRFAEQYGRERFRPLPRSDFLAPPDGAPRASRSQPG